MQYGNRSGSAELALPRGNPNQNFPSFQLGSRRISLDPSQLSRTFFCIGPICLRSGIGPGVGVGCGVGVMRGAMLPLGGESGNLDFLRQLPGGYQIMNVLKTVMRKFPGSKTGVGCGIGAGFGFGIGLAPAGGGSMMGGSTYGGMGSIGGIGGRQNVDSGFGGQDSRIGVQNQQNLGPSRMTGGALSSTPSVSESRIKSLEEKVKALEEKIGMHLKLKELEERLSEMESKRKR